MIQKIISGGQTGADQAALDAAIKLGVAHGGWISKGRRTENGPLADKYGLIEMPDADYAARTEKNILESDGTLILSHGRLTGGSLLTLKLAKLHQRPCMHMDLTDKVFSKAISEIHSWGMEKGIETLNVAGPRASKDPIIYESAFYVVEGVLLLSIVEVDAGSTLSDITSDELFAHFIVPKTVNQAIDQMLCDLDANQIDSLSRLEEEELPLLHMNLGMYVRNHFQLFAAHSELLDDCRKAAGDQDLHPEAASALIIRRFWTFLRQKRQ